MARRLASLVTAVLMAVGVVGGHVAPAGASDEVVAAAPVSEAGAGPALSEIAEAGPAFTQELADAIVSQKVALALRVRAAKWSTPSMFSFLSEVLVERVTKRAPVVMSTKTTGW